MSMSLRFKKHFAGLSEKIKSSEKPADIDCYYDGNKLRYLLKKYSADNELQILNHYYLTEPEF